MFLVMISAVLFSGVLSSCSKDEDFEANLAGYWYDSNTTYYLNGNGTGERTIEYVLTDKYLILTGFDGSGKWVLSKNKK